MSNEHQTTKTLDDLVSDVKKAVMTANDALSRNKIQIARVDLELKATVERVLEGGIEIAKILPVDLEVGGSGSWTDVQVISLSLVPVKEDIKLMSAFSDELADALEAIAYVVANAVKSQPKFDLKEGKVEVGFGFTKEGKVKVLVGGKANKEATNTITLTLTGATGQ
jgi:Trypsin-co-occurring domain 2